ncbi:MAG: ATP-binding protein [Fimbriimonas sp.]|nr:ATP-binding protein [Fimbriimonas sp.]
MKAPIPEYEAARLASLRQYELLDTVDEMAYDDLVVLAASVCKAPMACISLIDEDRQWLKSRIGIGFRDTDRDLSFCTHAILKPDQVMIVADALHDKRFADNDLVLGKPGFRFYTGVPLVNPEGYAMGALAIFDRETRGISVDQVEMLRALARQVVCQFELRKAKITLRAQTEVVAQEKGVITDTDRTKRTFLNNISHELRTPINGIIGISTLLEEGPLTDRQKYYVKTIEKSAENLLGLLGDILDYSRNEACGQTAKMSKIDLHDVVVHSLELMRPLAVAKGLALTFFVDEKLRQYLMADEWKLRQILANLIGNAMKFTAAGSIDVRVSQLEEDDQGVVGRFEIRDTGPGIPGDAVDKIFEPFVQLDQGPEHRGGGAGLGLSISRQLAEAIGARIRVKSELGRGSTFWFDLGLPYASLFDLQDGSIAISSNRKAMVFESNEINAMVLTAMLEKNGVEVEWISSPSDAVARLVAGGFDLAFLEVKMPDMEAVQIARHVRTLSNSKASVPMIAVTSSASLGEDTLRRSADFNQFLTKPIGESAVREALNRWLLPTDHRSTV